METFDVIVVGGGSAGTRAAKTAHEAGARTLLINDGELGGLCILRGCMPTKTMLHAAHLVHDARHHRTPGIGHCSPEIDFAAVMANKDAKVARFQRAKIEGIHAAGYEVLDARAVFTGSDTLESDGKPLRFRRGAVIASGSTPHVPPIQGLADVPHLSSDDVMRLTAQPASLLVVGSGAVGLEMAQFFSRIGTQVTLVSRRNLLEDLDEDCSLELEAALRHEPDLDLVCPANPVAAARTANGEIALRVATAPGEHVLTAAALLLATGRQPATANLGLAAAGVAVEHGRIVHGPDMATSNPRIFVAGDVTGRRQLLHVANQEGTIAGLGAAGVPGDHRIDHRLDMEVTFTDPVVATVGLTEKAAREHGRAVITALARFPQTGRAITMDVQHGCWKLVATPQGEIVGSQIVGPRADDLIHVIVPVIHHRGTARDLLQMPWYHPTLSEVILDLARGIARQVRDGA